MWFRCKGKLSFLMTKLAMVSNSKLDSADPPHHQQQQPWSTYSLHLCFLPCEMVTKVHLLLCCDNSAWTVMDTSEAIVASCRHAGQGWRRTLCLFRRKAPSRCSGEPELWFLKSVRCEFKMSADTDLFGVLSPAQRNPFIAQQEGNRVFQVDIYTPQQTV